MDRMLYDPRRGLMVMATVLWGLFWVGCREEIVPEPYLPSNAHDAYAHSLEQADLAETALGKEWTAAANQALSEAVEITLPFQESLYIDPAAAFAMGYRFSVLRGQKMEVEVELDSPTGMQLFMDLYRVAQEPAGVPIHVASGAQEGKRLSFEPRRDADYLVRVQAELLRGGRCEVKIRKTAALEFPVDGHSSRSIGSGFGAPRDGGRRSHHGVDIFAPRHTPVVATSRAWVRSVRTGNRGGRVVWLRDPERSLHLYFAHLETQDVQEGAWVEPGQRIGTVGNTGNARTTPPHLHFGIYARGEGPLDPYPFIHKLDLDPPRPRSDLNVLGEWARTHVRGISLRAFPHRDAPPVASLPLHTPMRIVGASGTLFRVTLPDDFSGYVAARGIESASDAIHRISVADDDWILDRPAVDGVAMDRAAAGAELSVLGRFGEYLWVETPAGRPGWMATPVPPGGTGEDREAVLLRTEATGG